MDSSQRVRAIISFIQTADCGSFAAAARALGISSAAVSKNVASLERSLGVRLMNRTTRTLKLTEEGAAFIAQARIGLDALEAAVDAVAAVRVEPQGRVRISSNADFGRDHLLPALPGLLSRYPALCVDINFDDNPVDQVKEGYDLVLRGGVMADSSLISRPVCRLKLVLVATPSYLAQHGIPETPQALLKHQLIAKRFADGKLSPWSFNMADGEIISYQPENAALSLSAPEALVQSALLHLGIAQVSLHHAWPHLQNGSLKVLLLDCHHPGEYEIALQYPHRALLAPRVRASVDYLVEYFADDEALQVGRDRVGEYSA